MPDQLHSFLVLVTSGSRVPDEVPDDDGRIGRTGDEDLVVVLEAQDRSLVTAQNVRRLARSDVPHANRAVALGGCTDQQPERQISPVRECRLTEPLMILRSSNWQQYTLSS